MTNQKGKKKERKRSRGGIALQLKWRRACLVCERRWGRGYMHERGGLRSIDIHRYANVLKITRQ